MEPTNKKMPGGMSGEAVEHNPNKKIAVTVLVIVVVVVAAVFIKKAIDAKKNAKAAVELQNEAAQELGQTENELFDIDAAEKKLDALKEKQPAPVKEDPAVLQERIQAMDAALNDLAQ